MLQPGDTIDIWVVESALGSGGMGSVYRCHNRAATRILAAIKVLDGGLTRYPEAEARFIREAEILFQLDHPNIVKVRNVRTDADPPYLEMEFVAGESLDERLRRGPIPFREAVALMRQTAEALAYLHSKGIYHRDIKPANLLVQPDTSQVQPEFRPLDLGVSGPRNLKLVDFGLAVEADGSRITQAGMAFGTVSYAPPEWISPETLDPAKWDMYAYGIVFHEILTGVLAFPVSGHGTARQQAMQVIIAKQNHPALDPGEAFHDDVRQLIRELTLPDPAQRLSDAAIVAKRVAALEPFLKRTAGVTLTPSTSEDPFQPTLPPRSDPSDLSMSLTQPRSPVFVGRRPTDEPITPRKGAPRIAVFFGAIGALLLMSMSVAALAAVTLWMRLQPTVRDVRFEITGVSAEDILSGSGAMPIVLHIGEMAPLTLTPSTLTPGAPLDVDLREHPFGPTIIRWVVGTDCTDGSSPDLAVHPWCTAGQLAVEISPGKELLAIPLPIETPRARDVAVQLPLLTSAVPLRAHLTRAGAGEQETHEGTRTSNGLGFSAVNPGIHTLSLDVGVCPGSSCESHSAELIVPVQGAPSPDTFAIEPPEPLPPIEPPKPRTEQPKLVHTKSGQIVTRAQLASFIDVHPNWAPGGKDAPKGTRKPYLGWLTEKLGSIPANGMTPALANAYCREQGMQVAGMSDEPALTPEMGLELRRVESGLKVVDPLQSGPLPTEYTAPLATGTVFRCVK